MGSSWSASGGARPLGSAHVDLSSSTRGAEDVAGSSQVLVESPGRVEAPENGARRSVWGGAMSGKNWLGAVDVVEASDDALQDMPPLGTSAERAQDSLGAAKPAKTPFPTPVKKKDKKGKAKINLQDFLAGKQPGDRSTLDGVASSKETHAHPGSTAGTDI